MNLLTRLMIVVLVTALCLIAFAGLYEFFNAVPQMYFAGRATGDMQQPDSSLGMADALTWGIMFRAPGMLFFGLLPLTLLFMLLEWRFVRSWFIYAAIWTAAALIAHQLHNPAATAAAAIMSGSIYWLLAGRLAGFKKPEHSTSRGSAMRLVGIVLLAYLGVQAAIYVWYGVKLLWVTQISEPGPGTPSFHRLSKRPMANAQKVALLDFPTAQSCMREPEIPASHEQFLAMDWDLINNASEAEVCIFRLLASYGDISRASAWFEAQGFEVWSEASSEKPYVNLDGTLRVNASHSIREHGPKFPTRGFIRRAFNSIPYLMHVDATWSQDGKELLDVRVGFNTL